jgi:hypothetical protein
MVPLGGSASVGCTDSCSEILSLGSRAGSGASCLCCGDKEALFFISLRLRRLLDGIRLEVRNAFGKRVAHDQGQNRRA